MKSLILSLSLIAILAVQSVAVGAAPLKALIIDGQNNHVAWPKTTFMMKKYLEDTKLFTVDIKRTAFTVNGENLLGEYGLEGDYTAVKKAQTDPTFKPKFSNYDVVISNFGHGAAPWPEETQQGLIDFVKGGGGLVIVHAADNSFGDWPEYNRMIGLGGWGGRNESSGPYVYLDDNGKTVSDTSKGAGGHHGSQHPFGVVVRDTQHPITKGMPREWLHGKDEL